MPEDYLEEEKSSSFDRERILDLVRRRHLQFLLPLLLGFVLVWLASWVMPVRYKSTTTILVQQPSVPKDYVTPNINVDLQARLASLTQQIESRTRLLIIANKLHLYADPHATLTPDQIVTRMRSDIGIDLVRDQESGAISGFTVSYSAPSARMAQQVTNELTSLFIQESQSTLQQESESTTHFLQQQLANARASLAEQDARVKQFRATHQGELPSQQASNLEILTGLQSQLQSDEDALNAAQQQQVYFQSLIEQYSALSASSSGAPGAPTDLTTLDKQLDNMKARLADLKARYTDRYPAVQNLESQIAQATKDRRQLLTELKARSAAAKQHGSDQSATRATDPATTSAVLQLESQLQATRAQIASREHDITSLKTRISEYQQRLNAGPASEEQLADLTRGYEQSQTNYNELLKKENDSAMATNMEQLQQGERFTILDPPSLPSKPDSPNRIKMCGIGLAFGLALGVGLAGGLEFLDDRLHRDKDIEELLNTAVLGEIPEIHTAVEQQRSTRRLVLGWTAAGVVLVTIAMGSAVNYLYATGSSFNLHGFGSSLRIPHVGRHV